MASPPGFLNECLIVQMKCVCLICAFPLPVDLEIVKGEGVGICRSWFCLDLGLWGGGLFYFFF